MSNPLKDESLDATAVEQREHERLNDLKVMLRLMTSTVAAPLYLVFWICDLFIVPEKKWLFLGYRVAIVVLSVSVNRLIRRVTTRFQAENLTLVFSFLAAFALSIMTFQSGGPTSVYYAGINLACLGILLFLPLSKRYAMYAILGIYVPFFGGNIYLGWGNWGALTSLFVSSFFVLSTLFMSLIIRHFHDRLRVAEVKSRVALEREVKTRDTTIKQKTEEAVKLSGLSSQFSPQVVHSIRRGIISLDAGIHRSSICAIFIDIVNSTERVTRIDKADLNTVISMFMDDTMKILLKYDITIDKFLGDGILAFSNDPIQYPDYIDRVLRAALEINRTIENRKTEYEDYWLRPLEVKIGIAQGFASVGFYGSGKYFRTYTAIGPCINLASRLCSVAEPNQICVARDVVRQIKENEFEFRPLGTKVLKGFESDTIKVYSLEGETHAQDSVEMGVMDCPKCAAIMYIDSSTGLFKLRCRECSYEKDGTETLQKAA